MIILKSKVEKLLKEINKSLILTEYLGNLSIYHEKTNYSIKRFSDLHYSKKYTREERNYMYEKIKDFIIQNKENILKEAKKYERIFNIDKEIEKLRNEYMMYVTYGNIATCEKDGVKYTLELDKELNFKSLTIQNKLLYDEKCIEPLFEAIDKLNNLYKEKQKLIKTNYL